MAAVENAASQRASMQDYKSCCFFLRQSVWDMLLAEPPLAPLQRVEAVVGFLVNSLGLRHPNEPSVAVIAALCVCREQQTMLQLQSLFATVKSVLRTVIARARMAGTPLPGNTYIEVLPCNVDELPLAVRQAAAPQGFAAIPGSIDHQEIMRVARSIPLRSTNRQVQLQRQMEQQGHFMVGGQPGTWAFQMMQSAQMAQAAVAVATAMAGQSTPRPREGELQNLQILSQGARTGRNSGLNALLDRAQEPSAALPQAPSSHVAATTAEAASEPASHPIMSKPANLEAVASDGQPDMASSAAAPPLALTDAPASSVQEGNDAPNVPAAAVGPNKVEAAMVRLAQSYYDKDLQADLSTQGPALKRPAAAKGRPRKRPAASQLSAAAVAPSSAATLEQPVRVLKRPASGKVVTKRGKSGVAAVRKRPASKTSGVASSQLAVVTKQQRLRWRPNGCSRCRNTKGCCPSCWFLRGYRAA